MELLIDEILSWEGWGAHSSEKMTLNGPRGFAWINKVKWTKAPPGNFLPFVGIKTCPVWGWTSLKQSRAGSSEVLDNKELLTYPLTGNTTTTSNKWGGGSISNEIKCLALYLQLHLAHYGSNGPSCHTARTQTFKTPSRASRTGGLCSGWNLYTAG